MTRRLLDSHSAAASDDGASSFARRTALRDALEAATQRATQCAVQASPGEGEDTHSVAALTLTVMQVAPDDSCDVSGAARVVSGVQVCQVCGAVAERIPYERLRSADHCRDEVFATPSE